MGSKASNVILLGLLLISVAINIYFGIGFFDNAGEESFDLNGDGVAEVRVRYEGAFERIEIDRNYDGHFDMKSFYQGGFVASSMSDDDFDGYYETKTSYQFGLPTETTITINPNGSPDITYIYESGVDSMVDIHLPDWKGKRRERLVYGLPESYISGHSLGNEDRSK